MQKTAVQPISEGERSEFLSKFENTSMYARAEVENTRKIAKRSDSKGIKDGLEQMERLTGTEATRKLMLLVKGTFSETAAPAQSYHIFHGVIDIAKNTIKGSGDIDGIENLKSFMETVGFVKPSREKQDIVHSAERVIDEVSRSESYDGASNKVLGAITKTLDEYLLNGKESEAIKMMLLMPEIARAVKGDATAIGDVLAAFSGNNKRDLYKNELVHIGVDQLRSG
ncbi:MAG: hypothetical protein KGI06_04025 [Candidatus Micrarchaeota archaeon]|nr:hypothetical protein [Candidatus Micrarchaeota archaeon]